jgi:hypothetical protein
MKNITVTVDDEVYRRARIRAAEQSSSVSGLVKGFLIRLAEEKDAESEFDRLAREEKELREQLRKRGIGLNASNNLKRDALHDRHALR